MLFLEYCVRQGSDLLEQADTGWLTPVNQTQGVSGDTDDAIRSDDCRRAGIAGSASCLARGGAGDYGSVADSCRSVSVDTQDSGTGSTSLVDV